MLISFLDVLYLFVFFVVFFFKQKTAYEMRISDWSSDVCSSDLNILAGTFYLRLMYDRFGYPGLFAANNAGLGRYAEHLAGRRALPVETVGYLVGVAPSSSAPAVAAAKSSLPSSIFAVPRNMVDVTLTFISRYSRQGIGGHGPHPTEIT